MLWLLSFVGPWVVAGQEMAPEVPREYQLKAVFLCRFAQFVQWPPDAFASPDSPVVIGVLGSDPFGSYLQKVVSDERVGNRRLAIQRFRGAPQARNCQLLFISNSQAEDLQGVLAALRGRSILTVGETADFAGRGGMIQFVTEQNHIRFRINLEAARAAHLQISSKLLELAEVVGGHKE